MNEVHLVCECREDERNGANGRTLRIGRCIPRKKERKNRRPRYPFISLITVGPCSASRGLSFSLALPLPSLCSSPCGEINKLAANALVRAQCAAICLGGFVYLALINFNNAAQPARERERDPRWLSGPNPRGWGAVEPFSARGTKPSEPLWFHPHAEFMVAFPGGSPTVARLDVGLV